MNFVALCLLAVCSTHAQFQFRPSLTEPEDPCAGVRCPELQCRRTVRIKGRCCPECEDPCTTTVCPEFTRCKTDALKTRAVCIETCENNGKCGSDSVCQLETSKVCFSGKDLCLTRATCKPGCPDVERTFIEDVCLAHGSTKLCENKGKRFCVSIGNSEDHLFICTCRDWGLKWSIRGPIKGMRCTNIREPLNGSWNDANQYICLPNSTPFRLAWFYDGTPRGINVRNCVEWKNAEDETWRNNYLCQNFPPTFPSDFEYFYTEPQNTNNFFHCQALMGLGGERVNELWRNNVFCTKKNTGLVWTNRIIPEMNCNYITLNKETKSRAFYCTPQWWGFKLETYFGNVSQEEDDCIRVTEPEDSNFVTQFICKAKTCPTLNCVGNCSAGFLYDEEGCQTCRCKSDNCAFSNCPHIRCREYEYNNGACCPTCKKLNRYPSNGCPKLASCFIHCSYGREKDAFGCDVPKCRQNPCDSFRCASFEECRVDSKTFEPYCVATKSATCGKMERFALRSIPRIGKCHSTGVCEKEKCGNINCKNSCPGGFYVDLSLSRRGCPTCQCKSHRCARIQCPELPTCDELVYVGDSCCPVCKPTCRNIKCTTKCAHGYQLDEFGCQSCTCKKLECDTTKCSSPKCTNPIELPGRCCPYCSEGEELPKLQCPNLRCPPCNGGYYKDYLGCNTCRCKPDFCESITCPSLNCSINSNPVYREGSCCPICSNKFTCPRLSCDVTCPGGYEFDCHGCMTCQCKPSTCVAVTCEKPTLCENPVEIKGKCCPICPKAEWKVLPKCGFVNKYWDLELGLWRNDREGTTVNCPVEERSVLDVCRTVYPNQSFYGVRKLTNYRTFDSWCFYGSTDCRQPVGAYEWECLTTLTTTAKDLRFFNFENDKVSLLPCLKFTPDGINSNHLCLSKPIGWKFSHMGSISGMRCSPVREPDDPTFDWSKAHICLPKSTPFTLNFHYEGLPDDVSMKKCIATPFMHKGVIHKSWKNNYICINDFNFVCNKSCNRYKKNANGNPLCECMNDPCENIQCGNFQECRWDVQTETPFCEDSCKNNGKCSANERCETHYNFDRRTKVATCKPKCTEFNTCNLDCPSGFLTDFNGCPKCTCRPNNCSNIQCPTLMCSKPVLPDGECCPACPAKCRCTKLTKRCPAGYEVDPEFGCFLDECKPESCLRKSCLPVSCNKTILLRGECCPRCIDTNTCPPRQNCTRCKSGYMINRLGCETCECKPDSCKGITCPSLTCEHKLIRSGDCCPTCIGATDGVICPHRRCSRFCKNGFEMDMNGCPTCNCKPEVCDRKTGKSCGDVDGDCKLDDAVSVWGKCGLRCPMKGFQCPTLPCENPVYFGWETCPRCPARCPMVRCNTDCTDTGYKYVNGCMTCECKPRECANRVCPKLTDCKYLIWVESDPCCPKCKETHCSGITCPRTCDFGFELVEIKGRCCRQCMRTKTPFPYICPAVYQCTKACPGGYKTDVYGCPTCECKPASCKKMQCPALLSCKYGYDWDDHCCMTCPSTKKKSFACPQVPCTNPVRFGDELCPRCPARCTDVRCKTRCATGYKYDTNGCMTCECRPDSCAQRTCPKLDFNCKNVIWTTDDDCCPKCAESHCKGVSGCPTSCSAGEELVTIQGECCPRCMRTRTPLPYVCPATRQCTMPCPGGYKVDLLGCPTCECKPDGCKNVRCPTPSCDFPYNYNSECCPRCAPADAATKPMCSELRCEDPVFVAGEMCPVCLTRSHFPDDFKFYPTTAPTPYCNWHDIELDWGPGYEPSLLKTRFPFEVKFTRSDCVPGMHCTPFGYLENREIADYHICIPMDSHIRLRFYRDGIDRTPRSRCLRIDGTLLPNQPRITPGYLCQVKDVMIPEVDVTWTNNGAEFYTQRGWTCVRVTPSSGESNGWNNNFVCSRYDFGFRWSSAGRLDNMECTRVSGFGNGDENHFCAPREFDFNVVWSEEAIDHMTCLKWTEPEQRDWNKGHLCFYKRRCESHKCNPRMNCPDGYTGNPLSGCTRRIENDVIFNCDKKCVFGFKKTSRGESLCECMSGAVDPFESCSKVCPNGYEYSLETGFRTCHCKPERCSTIKMSWSWNKAKKTCNFPITLKGECEYKCPKEISTDVLCITARCPTLKCANPVLIKGRCCPICPNTCPQIKCTKDCSDGFATDMHGCRRCHCLGKEIETTPCPEVTCTNQCVGGYQKDSNGCNTCRCKPESCAGVTCPAVKCSKPVYRNDWCCPRCPKIKNDHCPTRVCRKACPTGFEFDENGCMTCECKPNHCNRIVEESCWRNNTNKNTNKNTCLTWANVYGECRSLCADETNRCPTQDDNFMPDVKNFWGCTEDFNNNRKSNGKMDTQCSKTSEGSRGCTKQEEMHSGFWGFPPPPRY